MQDSIVYTEKEKVIQLIMFKQLMHIAIVIIL